MKLRWLGDCTIKMFPLFDITITKNCYCIIKMNYNTMFVVIVMGHYNTFFFSDIVTVLRK